MIDRLFSALLTFCLLAGGTVAIGTAMADYDRQASQPRQVVTLPEVTITGKREAPAVAHNESLDPAAPQVR